MRLYNFGQNEALWFCNRLPKESGNISVHFDEDTDVWEIEFDTSRFDIIIDAIHLIDEQCNFLTSMKFPSGP